jgi:hypothetical protein
VSQAGDGSTEPSQCPQEADGNRANLNRKELTSSSPLAIGHDSTDERSAEPAQKFIAVTIKVDQKAAIMRGEVLPTTVVVEIDPASLTVDERGILASYHPEFYISSSFEDPTLAGLTAFIVEKARAATKRKEEIAEMVASYEAAVEGYLETEPPWGAVPVDRNGRYSSLGSNLFAMDGWQYWEMGQPRNPNMGIEGTREDHDRVSNLSEKAWAHFNRFKAENEVAATDRKLEIDAFFTAQDNASAEALREASEAEAAELQAQNNWRLTHGKYLREFGRYNPSRCGSPWGAKVSLDALGKLEYNFRAAIYDGDASGGTIEVPCMPGEIVAVGQRDNRKPSCTQHYIFLMERDGEMSLLTPGRARKHLLAAAEAAKQTAGEACASA